MAFASASSAATCSWRAATPSARIAFLPLGVALFLVGYAATLPATIEPLVPALDNAPLLTIHVAMAMISYGIFAISFAAAVGYLVQGQDDRFAWLPSHKVLDEVAYRAVIIGFPIFATLIILGSYWASIAWGRYWGWDPKETSALVTWLIYAVYLHARNQRGWAGRPGRPHPRHRLRSGAVHLLRQPVLRRAARLQRPVGGRGRWAGGSQRPGGSERRAAAAEAGRLSCRVTSMHRLRGPGARSSGPAPAISVLCSPHGRSATGACLDV